MKVTITITGGIAGIERTGAIDTASLPTEEAVRVEEAVKELASRGAESGEIGADLFEYRIEASGEEGERSLIVRDLGEPEGPGDPLLAGLVEIAGLSS